MPPVTPGAHELLPFVAEKRPEGHRLHAASAADVAPAKPRLPARHGEPVHEAPPTVAE